MSPRGWRSAVPIPRGRGVLVALVAAALASLLVWGFLEGRKEAAMERQRERPVAVAPRLSIENGEIVITLDSATQRGSGIAVETLDSATRRREIWAFGRVMELQELVQSSNDYVAARAEAEGARASAEATRREHERLEGLYADDRNVSAKALEAAAATMRADQTRAAAAAARAQALAAAAREAWGSVVGDWLVNGSAAFERLLTQQDVLIQATLPPNAAVSTPPVTAVIETGGSRVSARFASRAGRTDPRIQGIGFFYVAPSRPWLLPGMNVVVLLPMGEEIPGALVPESAVVRWEGKSWIYVQAAPTRFVRREISTDAPGSGGGYVVIGFPPGARVVTRGAQLLLSEEFRSQIQVGEEDRP